MRHDWSSAWRKTMNYPRLTAALLAAVLIVGCSEQKAPTEATEDVLGNPSFNFTNGPESPGAIMRFQEHVSIVSWGEDFFVIQNMGVLDPAESPFCTLNFDDFDVFDIQIGMAALIKSEGTQHVYDLDSAGGELLRCITEGCESFCAAVQGPREAEGYGRIGINEGVSSATLKANGELQDLVNGGCARFHWVEKYVFPPGGSPKALVNNISLNHTGSTNCLD